MQERYIVKDGKRLRCGYTTGSCAAAAAKAAVRMLITGCSVDHIFITTPKGEILRLEVVDVRFAPLSVSCAVRKDGGDDSDVTDGALVYAKVTYNTSGEVVVDGGEGVGRVTRKGLDQPVGAAAINRVPRRMILQCVREEFTEQQMDKIGYSGVNVEISVPGGEELAKKTFNPRLGIVGGISILGTTGIVEPMSEAALIDTIRTELRVLRASSDRPILITPGNYGETFAAEILGLPLSRSVLCSNFLGDTLDYAVHLGFQGALLVGHIGKLVKVAGGIFQTHSRVADARMEIIAAHAAMAGLPREAILELMDAPTTDRAMELLSYWGFLEAVVHTLLLKMETHLKNRAGQLPVETVVFSGKTGFLGQTSGATALLRQLTSEEQL